MLFNEITNIIALSYSELGSTGLTIARNFNNGHDNSQKQKKLIKTARLIQMELKTILDHVVYDNAWSVSYVIRSTDEQINKSLTYLISLTETMDYSVGPTLFHKMKPTVIKNGADGAPGASPIFQYSVDGIAWHSTYVASDAYFRVSLNLGLTWSPAILFYNNGSDKVSKTGDTMSGNLVIPNGTIAGHAVNKGQLDGVAAAAAADATAKADAAKTYADNLTLGLWDDRGNFNASVNAYPSSGGSGTAGAIMKGDIWTVSVAGTLPTALVVAAGDTVRALVDTPGNTQANWAIAENNIGYVPVNKSGDTMSGNLAMGANKITGLAAATNNGEAVRFEQLLATPVVTPVIVQIGDWDMDTNASVNVAHGIADYKKIRGYDFVVRDDADTGYYNSLNSALSSFSFDGTNITIERAAASIFDSVTFNATTYNRGWVTIDVAP